MANVAQLNDMHAVVEEVLKEMNRTAKVPSSARKAKLSKMVAGQRAATTEASLVRACHHASFANKVKLRVRVDKRENNGAIMRKNPGPASSKHKN